MKTSKDFQDFNQGPWQLMADGQQVWSGQAKPSQRTIDSVAKRIERFGWNGVTMDILFIEEWVETVSPSNFD